MGVARNTFRQAMSFVHTWIGVVFSILLFLVFFMGTLSVFDQEIDRWMLPQTRFEAAPVSFDAQVKPTLETLAPDAKQWFIGYPTERSPAIRIGWREGGTFVTRLIDPNNGKLLPQVGSWGGTGFFFPFHYSFHIKWMEVGYWILAIVSIGMLALMVSGVIIHKKIFVDLFTFRPDKSTHRATLDVHNICGVLILPFHFLIVLSGLIIFIGIYFKPAVPLLFGAETAKASQEIFGQFSRPPIKKDGTLGSVDAMVAEAQKLWGGGSVRNVQIVNPHDRNAVVNVLRLPDDRVSYNTMAVAFDGASGSVLNEQKMAPMAGVQRFFSGLHMIPFSHWGIRWLYFLMGLGGCVLIASGLLLWSDKRKARHIKEGSNGYRLVDGLACAGTLGVVVATLAMLVANRLLPEMDNRPQLEASVYFTVWILSLVHAAWRSRPTLTRSAWFEQGAAAGAMAFLAMILNAATTGDHPIHTLMQGNWAVAGTDFVLLLVTLVAMWTVRCHYRKAVGAVEIRADQLPPKSVESAQ